MKYECWPQQPTPGTTLKTVEKPKGGCSVDQLMSELEALQTEKKIEGQDIPYVFDQINKRVLAEIGYLPEDEQLELLKGKKRELFSSILKRTAEEIGDLGNFEVFEKATKIITTEGKVNYGDDPDRPYFDTGSQKIYMGAEAMRMLVDPEILIALLAAKGSSGAANDLHHEYIHSQQVKKSQTSQAKLWEALNIFADKNILLKEIHAFIGADRKGNGKRLAVDDLRTKLNDDSYGLISSKEDNIRFDSASLAIKQLYALGLSDEDIGILVSKAKWDKTAGSYDELTFSVNKIMQDKNLSAEEVNNLVKIDELKTKLRIEKTRIIAKAEIQNFLK